MDRGLDLSRQAIASLAQIPDDVVAHVERAKQPYALSLAQNRLTRLHDVYIFTNVLQLDLSGNQLHSLEGITALQQLESLNLAHNRLTDIDPLATLPRLRVLNAAENDLTQVDALRQLKTIVAVDVSYNSITKWPQLSHVTTLESIDLSSNRLESFPVATAVRVFPRSLRRLLLGKNRIQELCGIAALGMFLQKLEILILDGNPATQRILREGGCLDFLFVNLFATVAFAKGQAGGVRRDNFVVSDDVVAAVEDAVQQGDESLLWEFLVTGSVPMAVFQRRSVYPLSATDERINDHFKVDELTLSQSRVPPPPPPKRLAIAESRVLVAPPSPPAAPMGETNGHGLSKESKMELWKRMMSERRAVEQPPKATSTQQLLHEASPVVPSSTLLSAVVAPATRAAPSRSPQTPPIARSIHESPQLIKPSPSPLLPPFSTLEAVTTQVKSLTDQVVGMRKYVKVWIKREQLTRDAAAKLIQRLLRKRQFRLSLSAAIQQSRARRRLEYGVQHCGSRGGIRHHPNPQQLHLYACAVVIQRHLRGWLMRFRVSRWMYYSQAASRIQWVWRQRRGFRLHMKHELGLTRRGQQRKSQNQKQHHQLMNRNASRSTQRLENAVAMLATDVRQLQRVFAVQEQMIARQWHELHQLKRVVENQNTTTNPTAAHAQKDDDVAALRCELESLKALVQSLVPKGSSS